MFEIWDLSVSCFLVIVSLPMNGHNFTVKAQEALQRAHEIATSRNHQQIDPLHLLSALLQDNEGTVAAILERMGADNDELRRQIDNALDHLPRVSLNVPFGQVYLTPDLARILERARKEAQKLTDEKNKAELPKKLLYWILYLRIRLVEPKSHKILKGLLSLNEIISKPQFNQRLALENFLVQL